MIATDHSECSCGTCKNHIIANVAVTVNTAVAFDNGCVVTAVATVTGATVHNCEGRHVIMEGMIIKLLWQ